VGTRAAATSRLLIPTLTPKIETEPLAEQLHFRAPTTMVRPLPVAAVHDVLERAPVGPLDRRERTVGGDAEGDQQGAEPVLGKAQQAPRELPVVDAGMGAADAEVGGGQHDAHRRLAQVEVDQSRIWASSELGATSAIVAAELATCRAAGLTLASCASCSRSVQTTKSHACWLPA